MQLFRYQLGQLQANCYFLIQDKECVIIDPADSADFILEQISRQNLNLLAMFATHGHFDHIMAAGEIQFATKAPFYIFREDEFLIQRLGETAQYFLGYTPEIIPITKIDNLEAKKNMKIGSFEFEVLHIPGHTPGSAAYYFSNEKWLFTGDTLFASAIGRYDFSYSKKEELKKSLERLLNLPQDTIVYPGHGESTTVKDEKGIIERYNL